MRMAIFSFDKFKNLIRTRTPTSTKDSIPRSIVHADGISTYGASYLNENIPMGTLMGYYHSSPRFRLTVNTNTNYAVGDGFYLTAGKDKMAQKHLGLITQLCKDIKMEQFAQAITTEMYVTGNAFFVSDSDGTLKHFPAAQVADIYHEDGIPTGYRIWHNSYGERATNMQTEELLTPDQIIHFRMNRIPGTPWGRSIGHIYCSRGVGFYNSKKKIIHRTSFAEIDEILEDSLFKTAHRGLPRFLVTGETMTEKNVDSMEGALDKMDIAQHFILQGGNMKVDTMELGSRANWQVFLDTLDRHISWCMQSPVAMLFSNPADFAYASSKEAASLMFPGIDTYQRLLKEFIEQEIFKPFIDANSSHAWDAYPVAINWGREETTDLDNIAKLWQFRRQGMQIAESSIIKMIQKTGYSIEGIKSEMSPEMAAKAAKKKQPLDPNARLRAKMERYVDSLEQEQEQEQEQDKDKDKDAR